MKIVFVRPYAREEVLIANALPEAELLFVGHFNEVPDEVAHEVEIISVFVDTIIDETILSRFTNLKFIATRSAGFDHIAVTEAQAKGIVISRVPHYGSQTVAEYTFALLFGLSRNAYQAHLDMCADITSLKLERYEGFDLGGKTLGVIGTGLIGQKVCAIGKSFGMQVIAFDQFPNDAVKAMGIPYISQDELLQQADVITLHVPGRPETHHLINTACFAQMKKTAYLINTARGEVVDTEALVIALREGRVAGAGLDVLEYEHELVREHALTDAEKADTQLLKTLAYNNELLRMKNVLVTPHIAFDTKEAKEEITAITIANIKAFIATTPTNVVSL